MKFNISGNMRIIEEIEAETLNEAIKKFKKRNPGVHIGSINWNTCEDCIYFTGTCKICGNIVYNTSFNNYIICKECKKDGNYYCNP